MKLVWRSVVSDRAFCSPCCIIIAVDYTSVVMSTDPVVRCSCSLFIADDQSIDDSVASDDGEAIALTDSTAPAAADGGSIGPRSPATPERSIIVREKREAGYDERETGDGNGKSRWRETCI